MTAAIWLFWLAVALLVYAYAGFAVVVGAAGMLLRRRVRVAPITPDVTLVVAAFNEEAGIAARLDNALAMDYPPERRQIIVASDGSTDATDAIVAQYADRGVQLLPLRRMGKIRALNEAVRHATGEILVFSDANTFCNPRAVRVLAENFADPAVGGVVARTSYDIEPGSESSSRGESLYLDYDTWLKALESQTGSVVSAQGGLYAIRRALFEPIADPAVTDDFAISTAVVARGYRLVFEPRAQATELAVPDAQREFGRRVRLMTRGLRSVLLRKRLLNPFHYGFYSVVLFSHKVVRRLAPLALVVLLVAAGLLQTASPLFALAFAAQALFYSLAVAGWLLRRRRVGRLKALYVPFYYCMANAACVVAFARLVRRERVELWQPQRRTAA